MKFVDTHSHLALLKDEPVERFIDRAAQAGVDTMLTVSTDEPSWELNRLLAERFPRTYYTVGVHPHDAKDFARDRMHAYLKQHSVRLVGVGELGLDFHYNLSTREQQILALEAQVDLAREFDLPLIIHCRDAFDDLYATLKRAGMGIRTGVMHCFTGGVEEAKRAVDLGLKISFSGILTFKNAEKIREAAKLLPASEILVETDCPFLAPVPLRGKPNEPSFLPHTAHCLAVVRGVPVVEIARQTTENAYDFFRLS